MRAERRTRLDTTTAQSTPHQGPGEFLATNGWLAAASPALREAILGHGRWGELGPGEQVHVAGDERVGMWGIANGQVGIISAVNASEAPTGYVYRPGDWGGYAPLLGSPRRGDAVARTAVVILFVPYQTMQRMLVETPAWWADVARLALHDVARYGSWGTDLLLRDSRARVAAILLHLAGSRQAGLEPAEVVVSQSELGDMTNLSRHPVSIVLNDFEAAGWIACGYRRIDVLNPTALRRLADNL